MILSLLFEFIYGEVTFLDLIQSLVFSFAAILIAMTVHEFCHALAAYALGDKTAKADGRLSLNPLNHLDPWGLLLLILFGFGWARPVNVNYSRLRHRRSGLAITAAAGPLSNFVMAFISVIFIVLSLRIPNITVAYNLNEFLSYLAMFNISLGIFNLIPVPPLDGSKIVGELLPAKTRFKYYGIERYSMIILLAIIILFNRLGIFGVLQIGVLNVIVRAVAGLFGFLAV